MAIIRDLFESTHKIDRLIEKVITYDRRNEEQLKQEIIEYIATDSVEGHFERLLDLIDRGMQGERGEVGVWVSGFYGSGKSSFTKYLGFALDSGVSVDSRPFVELLADQFEQKPLQQQLKTVAKRHDPAVFMLDLSTQNIDGLSSSNISNVLFENVSQWAGYPADRKVAYLERALTSDGRMEEFEQMVAELGWDWKALKKDKLASVTVAGKLVHHFYPNLFAGPEDFKAVKIDEAVTVEDRVAETLAMIREKTGKDNIVIIIDEVGQYVAPNDERILDLDGLAKLVKQQGDGKVWILATAQQTLAEDDPRARYNSAKLFKLKDRFPVSIDLEAHDIREICHRRLLGKSADGRKRLEEIWDKHGPTIKVSTKIEGSKFYKSDLDRELFSRLYPFLPHYFQVLLELLGKLSRSSGGLGLRSAIRVIQDVLIQAAKPGAPRLADLEVGTLASADILFDTLRRDIQRSFKHVVEGADRAVAIFGESSLETRVAKAVAVLQLLEDFPVTPGNVAAFLFKHVTESNILPDVEKAVSNLLSDQAIPLTDSAGLKFVNEAVGELDGKRRDLVVTAMDRVKIKSKAITAVFSPLPSVTVHAAKRISTGIQTLGLTGTALKLAGEREEIQIMVELVSGGILEHRQKEIVTISSQPAAAAMTYLIAAENTEFDRLADEIFRANRIVEENRTRVLDREINDYLEGQRMRAQGLQTQLEQAYSKSLADGTFVFNGKSTAVATLSEILSDAVKAQLKAVGEEVYRKFPEAPVNVAAGQPEQFLKTDRLDKIPSDTDPLGLVDGSGRINLNHAALVSVRDYLQTVGQADGKTIMERFGSAPYGWSKDTIRYLVAALLVGGTIKLRIGGEDFKVRSEGTIAVLKNTTSFAKVGVSLQDAPVSPEFNKRAAERLLEITSEKVLPIPDRISKHVTRHFPDLQQQYAVLPTQLERYGLPGIDRAQAMIASIAEIQKGDASDAAGRLGPEECPFFQDLMWAKEVRSSLDKGLGESIDSLQRLTERLGKLPKIDPIISAQSEVEPVMQDVTLSIQADDFYRRGKDFKEALSKIGAHIEEAQAEIPDKSDELVERYQKMVQDHRNWTYLGADEQGRWMLELEPPEFGDGIEALGQFANWSSEVGTKAHDMLHRLDDLERPSAPEGDGAGQVVDYTLNLPRSIRDQDDLEALIQELTVLAAALDEGKTIRLT